ncbi:uncharacterized protein [Anoplolepis gracilipes]|uniref:uncharacterized protein n=1 Tax=Anoplolepis gracilipes TaxID=354296 RepID=UPI003BA39C21
MFITILLLFIFLLLGYNYYYMYHGRNGRLINLLPGPPYLPIVGNVFQFNISVEELWKFLCSIPNEYYPIFKFWVFAIPVVSVRHPDDLETILSSTKHIEKSMTYNLLHPWLRTGLLTSAGAKWQARRKMLTPAFHFNILNQFLDILIKESDCMTKSLKDVGGTVVKDLIPFISEHTLNAICETAMGISLQQLGQFQQQYRNAIHDMSELLIYRLFKPWTYKNSFFSLLLQGRKQKEVLKILHGFTEKIIAERKLYHKRTNGRYLKNFESNKEIDDIEVFGIKKKRLAMLDLLIVESQKGFLTDLDIREEVDTFMFEGHDTTAMGITFALLLLAEHKDIQERVRIEINTVMQENGGKLTMKALQNLSYLEKCLKETLRLYPSVFIILRKTAEDVKLQSYVIPAKTIVHLNIYGVHRDPNFWPNPEVFDPDRFLPERIQNHHPYSYIPFSAGPRNCIGQRFAMLELKAMIASLVHNFYLEPVEYLKDVQLKVDIIIRPSHPVHMKFIPITCKQHKQEVKKIKLNWSRLSHQETMFITILLLFIFILLVCNYYMHYGRNGRLINLIPGPPGLPIFGYVLQVQISAEKLMKLLFKVTNKYYPILKIWLFFMPVVSIRHPDDVETILSSTKHIEKSRLYDSLLPWLGTGLLTSTGTKWQTRRKILTPTFHFNILNQFVDVLIKESNCMTKSLKDAGGIVVKDLSSFVSEHTLNAICETAMGISLQNLDESQQQYRNAINDIIQLIIYRVFRPWFYNNWLFSLSPQGRKQKKLLKILHGFTEKIIAERKLYHQRTNGRYLKNLESDKEIDDVEVFGIKKKRLAMLDLLIAASREGLLTDLDIREEVDTFMFEGYDTTARNMMFALLLLAEHKDIQERVRVEVDIVMQENGGKLTMKALQNLSYLERCLKEALRLYPSVFLIFRKAAKDVKLQSYVIPAGTIIHLHIYGVHRDPNFWPNPEVFDPDRFLPERIQNRHPYSYIPFSAGPRNCIGQRFALLELKATIASLVHNFYLEPVDYLKNLQLKADLLLCPSRPLYIKFIPINHK